jgi:hypothetical protein
MATQWHHSYFPLPLLLSLFEWGIFSLYWSTAAKNRSRPISSESSKSRRLHEVLFISAKPRFIP